MRDRHRRCDVRPVNTFPKQRFVVLLKSMQNQRMKCMITKNSKKSGLEQKWWLEIKESLRFRLITFPVYFFLLNASPHDIISSTLQPRARARFMTVSEAAFRMSFAPSSYCCSVLRFTPALSAS